MHILRTLSAVSLEIINAHTYLTLDAGLSRVAGVVGKVLDCVVTVAALKHCIK